MGFHFLGQFGWGGCQRLLPALLEQGPRGGLIGEHQPDFVDGALAEADELAGNAVPGTSHTGFMNLAEVIWNRGWFPPRRRFARASQVRAWSGYAGHGFRLSAGR